MKAEALGSFYENYASLPDDIAESNPLPEHAENMRSVLRFDHPDYPEFIRARDNVLDHTYRAVHIARLLSKTEPYQTNDPLPPFLLDGEPLIDWQLVEDIIWIHDIPEIKTGDTPAIVKDVVDPLNQELSAAQEFFEVGSPHDENYHNFIIAETWLENKQRVFIPTTEALIAKTLDFVEGSYTYFWACKKRVPNLEEDTVALEDLQKIWKYAQAQKRLYTDAVAHVNASLIGSDWLEGVVPEHAYGYTKDLITRLLEDNSQQIRSMFPDILQENRA